MNTILFSAFAVMILTVTACDDTKNSVNPVSETDISVTMHHHFGDAPVEPDVSLHTNSSGNYIRFSKLHYLMTNFALVTLGGDTLSLNSAAAYINLGENQLSFTLSEVPLGTYKELHFILGVDSATNHQNPNTFAATSPLNPIINNLYWDWMDGFIFCSVEGYHYDSAENLQGAFAYHVGKDENRMAIVIAEQFTITETTEMDLVFDMAAYFESPHVINITENAPITHSDSGADFGLSSKLSKNLLNAFSFLGS